MGLPEQKFPRWEAHFAKEKDFKAHIETQWTESKNGNGEWLPAELDPQLASMLSIVGVMIKDGYRYSLIDGKTILKKKPHTEGVLWVPAISKILKQLLQKRLIFDKYL